MEYVLVIKQNNNVRIGRKTYTKEKAIERLGEVKLAGIDEMEIMSMDEALGLK